jgi:hypothetical protein
MREFPRYTVLVVEAYSGEALASHPGFTTRGEAEAWVREAEADAEAKGFVLVVEDRLELHGLGNQN